MYSLFQFNFVIYLGWLKSRDFRQASSSNPKFLSIDPSSMNNSIEVIPVSV